MASSVPPVKRKRITTSKPIPNAIGVTHETISFCLRNNQEAYTKAGKEFNCSYTDVALIIALVDLYGEENNIEFRHTKEYYRRSNNGFLYSKLQSLVDQGFLLKTVETMTGNKNITPYQFKWSFTAKAFDVWGYYYNHMMVKVNA